MNGGWDKVDYYYSYFSLLLLRDWKLLHSDGFESKTADT